MNRERRQYTAEFKAEALRMIAEQGLSLAEVSRRLGIHPNLLRNWKNKSADNGPVPAPAQPTAVEAELLRLRAENERLRMERDILKKATARRRRIANPSGVFAKESR